MMWDLNRWLSCLQNGQSRERLLPPTAYLKLYTNVYSTAKGAFWAPFY